MNAWSRISTTLRLRQHWTPVLKARANALSCCHAALRPSGLVLDLQISGGWVEVVAGGAILPLGSLLNHRFQRWDVQDTLTARDARQVVIDAGQFVLEREVRFPYVEHYDTRESRLTRTWAPTRVIPAVTKRRARELPPPGTAGEGCVTFQGYAGRLRRT